MSRLPRTVVIPSARCFPSIPPDTATASYRTTMIDIKRVAQIAGSTLRGQKITLLSRG